MLDCICPVAGRARACGLAFLAPLRVLPGEDGEIAARGGGKANRSRLSPDRTDPDDDIGVSTSSVSYQRRIASADHVAALRKGDGRDRHDQSSTAVRQPGQQQQRRSSNLLHDAE